MVFSVPRLIPVFVTLTTAFLTVMLVAARASQGDLASIVSALEGFAVLPAGPGAALVIIGANLHSSAARLDSEKAVKRRDGTAVRFDIGGGFLLLVAASAAVANWFIIHPS